MFDDGDKFHDWVNKINKKSSSKDDDRRSKSGSSIKIDKMPKTNIEKLRKRDKSPDRTDRNKKIKIIEKDEHRSVDSGNLVDN